MIVAPSGEQFEIAFDGQRAVVVEVGGGLRTYSVDGRDVARRLRGRRDVHGRARAGADPVAEPHRRTAATSSRAHVISCRSTEPEIGTRSTGSSAGPRGRWPTHEPRPRRDGARRSIRSRGIRSRSTLSIEYALCGAVSRVRTTATNIGATPVPVRERRAPVPHRRERHGRHRCPAVPARTVLESDERGYPDWHVAPSTGTELDFRRHGRVGYDEARQRLHRSRAGRRRARPRRRSTTRSDGRVTLWVDEGYPYLMVFTATYPTSTPQPRGRAHDLPAERVPERRGSHHARAWRVAHGCMGAVTDDRGESVSRQLQANSTASRGCSRSTAKA